jgi:predicted regulator of Ras-like GTPase activity (Roadblock/LC7/MglB family)
MTTQFRQLLSPLTRQRAVLGCMVVGESDGLIIDSTLQVGVHGEAVAALAASLFRKARLSAETAGLGSVGFLRLEAQNGHVCAAGRSELVLVAVAESRANIGLLRAAMLRAAETLA